MANLGEGPKGRLKLFENFNFVVIKILQILFILVNIVVSKEGFVLWIKH